MKLARRATWLLVLGLTAGCAAHRRATLDSRETSGAASSTVVTGEELARLMRQGSLMDAIRELRPLWLVARGTLLLVSVDGSAPADLTTLQLIAASTVQEVRLQRASSSVGRAVVLPNGDVVVADLIVVSTRRGRPARY